MFQGKAGMIRVGVCFLSRLHCSVAAAGIQSGIEVAADGI